MKSLRIFVLLLSCSQCLAFKISAVSFGIGSGFRDNLVGGRFSLQSDWNKIWFEDWALNLTGYWDGSVGYWHTTGDRNGEHDDVVAFAVAPVLKLQFNRRYTTLFDPYLQISIGGALVTDRILGNSNLSSVFLFQDLVGFGVRFGPQKHFDFSFNFLHYSNADIIKPNNGLTAKRYIALAYHF